MVKLSSLTLTHPQIQDTTTPALPLLAFSVRLVSTTKWVIIFLRRRASTLPHSLEHSRSPLKGIEISNVQVSVYQENIAIQNCNTINIELKLNLSFTNHGFAPLSLEFVNMIVQPKGQEEKSTFEIKQVGHLFLPFSTQPMLPQSIDHIPDQLIIFFKVVFINSCSITCTPLNNGPGLIQFYGFSMLVDIGLQGLE